MPIYEYACRDAQCTHQFEIRQAMQDARLTQCPACGQETLDKLISRTTFRLTGKDWFRDEGKSPTSATAADSKKKDAAPKDAGDSKDKATQTGETGEKAAG